jgi:putative ABC transport system permease protein
LIYRLVWENLKHRPVRTLLSAVFVGISVTLILTLVGLSEGTLGEMQQRSRGTGADIVIRPPNSTVLAFTGNMPDGDKLVALVRRHPHVKLVTGVLVQGIGNFESIAGINFDEFNAMSGGFHYFEGGPFQGPNDLMVDQNFARSKNLRAGRMVDLGNGHLWRVCAVVEPGKLSQLFAQIRPLQEMYSATNQISAIYVQVDQPANINAVKADLENTLEDYKVFTMQQLIDLVSVDNVPILKGFTRVVIGISVIVGFLVVLLTMYTAVLERTREIGILKALGASPGYVLGVLLREALLLAMIGTIAGIVMTFGTQGLMHVFAPAMLTQVMVPDWWPIAGLISLVGAILGALYPGLKAARLDAIEALSYD